MRKIIFAVCFVGLLSVCAGLFTATGQFHQARAATPAQEATGEPDWLDTPAWGCIVPLAIVAVVVVAIALGGWRSSDRPGGAQGYKGYKADMEEANAAIDAAREYAKQPLPYSGGETNAFQAAREAIENTRGLTAEGKRRRLAELLEMDNAENWKGINYGEHEWRE